MNQNHTTLLDRLPAHAKTATIRASLEASLAVVDRYAARRNEMGASGKYTESGTSGAIRDMMPATLRSLQVCASPIAALKREVENERARLHPADTDPANLVCAMQQGETRQYLRSLPPLEREALLLGTNDLRLIEAAVTAPPELSGFIGDYRETVDRIEARYVELKHPTETAELATLETLVSEAEAIVAIARNSIRDTARMEIGLFESEARRIEAAVWIVGDAGREQVCEPGPNGAASYRPATTDEIATGVRYADSAAYYAARAA